MIKTPQKLLLDSFEKNLKKNALWDNEKFYTYKKILDFTKPIIKKLQYYNSKKVAVLNEKNIFCYCSILSIFLDNKIFVPLNHRFSNTKNIYILKKAKIDTILVGEQFLTKAIELKKILKKNLNIILVDRKIITNSDKKHNLKKNTSKLTDNSYIFFTSGTTGNPKGVTIKNINLSNYIYNLKDRFKFRYYDKFSNNFDITFDLFLHDLFISWTSGACLYIPNKNYFFNPSKFINKYKITCWFSVPSLGINMIKSNQLKNKNISSLKYSAFCGEALPEILVKKWEKAAPKSIIENLYGPTEATIAISGYKWNSKKSPAECEFGFVPIGKIFNGNKYLKYKKRTFELSLSGNQVFEGYLNEKTINKKKFLKKGNKKYFKTGDIITINKLKNLIFIGRSDRQIKVRGFRIEPQEIENVIKKTLNCQEVAVVGNSPILENKHSFENIVAFIRSKKIVSKNNIIKELLKKLSFNQIPSKIIYLKKFEYNNNNKINYKFFDEYLKNEDRKKDN